MSVSRSLPIIMPSMSGQKWSCHGCGNCCRTLVVHLSSEDRERIDRQGWEKKLGVVPCVRAGRGFALNKRPDGACVFLDDNTRCVIHSKHGEHAKPFACRIFPFSVRPVRRAWQASYRFDCPSVALSKGKPISQSRAWLGKLTAKLGHNDPAHDDVADLQRGLRATREEVDMILTGYARWLTDADRAMMIRLIGAARITATLRRTSLKKVRGSRLGELLDLLFAALPAECATTPAPATARQRAMLRQLVFAHGEHVSLADQGMGLAGRLRLRWKQLRSARVFLQGKGMVPRLPGFTRDVSFDTVESVGPPTKSAGETDDLFERYLVARLAARSVSGDGYYGWPVLGGLTALCLSAAVTGFVSRCIAAGADRAAVCFEDVADALGIVDRAATRLPSLGTTAERARVQYLSNDDGVARLIHDYAPLEGPR